ncbi:MAG: sensor histidine kinase [Clostridiales bacterium]|nr:sensor histidine kinase [Candidatus Cacconaster stercorequi]
MLITFVKHLFIIGCSTYITPKILNKKCSWRVIILLSCAGLMSAGLMMPLRQVMRPASTIIMVAVSIIVTKVIYGLEIDISITATIISYGISYISYLLGIILLGSIFSIIGYHPDRVDLLSTGIVGSIQAVLTILLFRIKRLRHGFPFLLDSRYGDLGVYLSTTILVIVSFLGVKSESQYIVAVLFSVLLICGLVLWFWWKKRITKEYLEQLRQKERQELQAIISSKDDEIAMLKKENETFSKIIHKDNKLIPAMELAVKETLCAVAHNNDPDERILRAEKMLAQLESVSAERTGIVSNYEHTDHRLPSTGVLTFDALFSYMLYKASAKDVSLELDFDETVNELIPKVISPEDASTLLADLLENAIIAAGENNQNRCVRVEFIKKDTYPCICISDTGSPFPDKVKQNWGIQRVTTHADSGGSGIGMMTTYEICKQYCASFLVSNFEVGEMYTKCVSVCFDGAGRCSFGNTSK